MNYGADELVHLANTWLAHAVTITITFDQQMERVFLFRKFVYAPLSVALTSKSMDSGGESAFIWVRIKMNNVTSKL